MKIKFALLMLIAAAFGIQASEDNLIRDPEFKEQRKAWPVNAAATFQDGVLTLPINQPRKKPQMLLRPVHAMKQLSQMPITRMNSFHIKPLKTDYSYTSISK